MNQTTSALFSAQNGAGPSYRSVMVQGDIMAETVEGESRNPAADAVAVAVYSVLVLLLMLAWTYVPA
jgi:hypothetical protein